MWVRGSGFGFGLGRCSELAVLDGYAETATPQACADSCDCGCAFQRGAQRRDDVLFDDQPAADTLARPKATRGRRESPPRLTELAEDALANRLLVVPAVTRRARALSAGRSPSGGRATLATATVSASQEDCRPRMRNVRCQGRGRRARGRCAPSARRSPRRLDERRAVMVEHRSQPGRLRTSRAIRLAPRASDLPLSGGQPSASCHTTRDRGASGIVRRGVRQDDQGSQPDRPGSEQPCDADRSLDARQRARRPPSAAPGRMRRSAPGSRRSSSCAERRRLRRHEAPPAQLCARHIPSPSSRRACSNTAASGRPSRIPAPPTNRARSRHGRSTARRRTTPGDDAISIRKDAAAAVVRFHRSPGPGGRSRAARLRPPARPTTNRSHRRAGRASTGMTMTLTPGRGDLASCERRFDLPPVDRANRMGSHRRGVGHEIDLDAGAVELTGRAATPIAACRNRHSRPTATARRCWRTPGCRARGSSARCLPERRSTIS